MKLSARKSFHQLIKGTIALAILLYAALSDAASGITFHGKILKPDNSPVSSANTQFRIQIRSPGSENCLLWEETQSFDMSSSNGVFTLTIADTSATNYLRTDSYSWGLDRVFSNRLNFSALANCTVGTTYNPSTADGRLLQAAFREQPTDPWENMSPVKVNYVPMSLNSVQLAGYQATEFLKIDPASTQTPLTTGQVTTLLDLVTGNYLKAADATTGDLGGTYGATIVDGIRGVGVDATLPTLNQVLKFNGTVWAPAADDAGTAPGDASYAAKGVVQLDTNLATSGLNIAAGVLSMPNVITAGGPTGNAQTIPVITYDAKGRLTTVTTATVDDTSKLSLDGSDTMTGALNMGNQNITNANSVSSTGVGTRTLTIYDADNSNYATLQVPSVLAANYALTLPADDGTAGQVLTTDGNGVLSWGVGGGGSASGAAGSIQFSNGTTFASDNSNLFWDDTNNRLGVGTTTPTETLHVNGNIINNGVIKSSGTHLNVGLSNSFGSNGDNIIFGLSNSTSVSSRYVNIFGQSNNNLGGFWHTIVGDSNTIAVGTDNTITIGRGITNDVDNSIMLGLSNTNKLTMLSSGYMGLGTTAPTGKLEIYDNVAGDHLVFSDSISRFTANLESGGVTKLVFGLYNDPITMSNEGLLIKNRYSPTSTPLIVRGHAGQSGDLVKIQNDSATDLFAIGPSGYVEMTGASAPALSPAGEGRIYFDSTSNKFRVSQNGGAYSDLVGGSSLSGLTAGGVAYATSATTVATDDLEFFWDDVTNRLGIGTNSPDAQLDLEYFGNTFEISQAASIYHFSADGINSPSPIYTMYNGDITNGQGQGLRIIAGNGASDFPLKVENNGSTTELFNVRGDGKIGIGTAAPTGRLTLQQSGVSMDDGLMILPSAGGSARIYNDGGGPVLNAAGGDVAKFGSTAIETFSPFWIWSNDGDFVSVAGQTNGNHRWSLNLEPSNGSFNIIQQGGSWASEGTRMTISRFGNVGIGTTTPITKFHLQNGSSSIAYTPNGRTAATIEGSNSSGTALSIVSPTTGKSVIFMANPTASGEGRGQISYDHSNDSWGFYSATVGSNWLTATNTGNVGIGTNSPTAKLHVAGQIVSSQNNVTSGATVDFSTGNVQIVQAPGGSAITLNNMIDGGSYTVVITDTTPRTYTFTNCTVSRFVPANDVTNGETVYSILKTTQAGVTKCYISWIPGF